MESPAHVVDAINEAWRSGQADALGTYFDPEMVIVGPEFKHLASGVASCIASYRDFFQASIIHAYQESRRTVHEFGDVAIVTYSWEMDFEQRGHRSRERGTDQFVLRWTGDRWLAVWRAVNFHTA